MREETFDLLLLGSRSPDTTGVEVLAWVADNVFPPPPVIMIADGAEQADVVAGLRAGEDDHITTLCSDDLLKARIEAVLRRTYRVMVKPKTQTFGEYAFDIGERLTIGGAPVFTTAKEFSLALLLFRNQQRPLSNNYITEWVWGTAHVSKTRTLASHISRIRNRLRWRRENGWVPSRVRRFGYRLESAADRG